MYSITMKYCAGGLVLAGVEDLHDVGVHQARGGLGLALEARHERGFVGEVLGEQLDRDLALEAQVEGEMDGGHPAEAEAALEAVAPGDLAGAHLPPSWAPGAPPPGPDAAAVFTDAVGARFAAGPGFAAFGRGGAATGAGCGRDGRGRRGARCGARCGGRCGGGGRRGRVRVRGRGGLGAGEVTVLGASGCAHRVRAPRAQVGDALVQRVAQAGVDAGRQRGVVLFGFGDRRFGRRAVAVAALGGLFDGFEVGGEGARVGQRDQLAAGAAAADEQRGGDPERARAEDPQQQCGGAGRARAPRAGELWCMLTDRTPGARRASPVGAPRGSRRRRRRCRSRSDGRRRPCRRGRAAATTRAGRRRGAVRRCRG